MKRFLILCFFLTLGLVARGQRVGVVLSGGGAKGLYHVGILKALEENNIPIDYISGASMGAIVGGMYAAGYSPDEMIRFFITDSVQRWLSAKSTDLDNNYYFKKFEPTPTMMSVRFDPKAPKKAALQLPTNLVSPYLLDLAFIRMLYPASGAAGNDFDSLMVPFRCNASNVFEKESVVFDRGSLPFAIRASMTIPLVFKPLSQDSVVLFDGGLYNNYPWQPLDSAFHPDILIGGICAGVDLLNHAGILDGLESTLSADRDLVNDGRVITARANAYVDFAIETAKELELFEDEADLQETIDFWKYHKRAE